jgi:hypothetical protein
VTAEPTPLTAAALDAWEANIHELRARWDLPEFGFSSSTLWRMVRGCVQRGESVIPELRTARATIATLEEENAGLKSVPSGMRHEPCWQTGSKLIKERDEAQRLLTETRAERDEARADVAGLGEMIGRIVFGQPVYPCPEASQDVAMVAFTLHRTQEALTAALREADRLRHGAPIEGDHVCPDALRADEAERERERDKARVEAESQRKRAETAIDCANTLVSLQAIDAGAIADLRRERDAARLSAGLSERDRYVLRWARRIVAYCTSIPGASSERSEALATEFRELCARLLSGATAPVTEPTP